MGMIPKKDLKDGYWYQGNCRNAELAYWMEKEQHFIHIRHKFGDAFVESIKHPEDEEDYDVFVPMKEVPRLTTDEIIAAQDDLRALEEKQENEK